MREQQIGREQDCRRDRRAQAPEVGRHEEQKADGETDDQHREQRGKDSTHAPLVESQDREAAVALLFEDERCDQITGDDKKDVDPDIAAAELCDLGVVQKHRNDRRSA